MKTLNLLLLGAAGCFFLSCSDDDSDSTNTKSHAGIYALTSVQLAGSVDFNQDGVTSSNLMSETECYNNSTITLKDDKTYVAQYNYVKIGTDVTCDSEISSGTWEVQGTQLLLTNTMMTPELTTTVTLQDNTIINILPNSPYPDRDTDGVAVYSSGLVTLNYTKK